MTFAAFTPNNDNTKAVKLDCAFITDANKHIILLTSYEFAKRLSILNIFLAK